MLKESYCPCLKVTFQSIGRFWLKYLSIWYSFLLNVFLIEQMIGLSFHFRCGISIDVLSGEGFGLVGFQKHILALSFSIAKENLQSWAHKLVRQIFALPRTESYSKLSALSQMWCLPCCSFGIIHDLWVGHSATTLEGSLGKSCR